MNKIFKLREWDGRILEVYRKFEDVEINDVMYLEKVIRKMKNEKIVRKVIKKSIY